VHTRVTGVCKKRIRKMCFLRLVERSQAFWFKSRHRNELFWLVFFSHCRLILVVSSTFAYIRNRTFQIFIHPSVGTTALNKRRLIQFVEFPYYSTFVMNIQWPMNQLLKSAVLTVFQGTVLPICPKTIVELIGLVAEVSTLIIPKPIIGHTSYTETVPPVTGS
jgi:hypothetical protein